MREKELRLAVVCFGGVSLAVYMHGVTKEILKLARASAAYHSEPDLQKRRSLSYRDLARDGHDEIDTEEIYFELLKAMGDKLDLRVIIDAVAGASAGGMNAVFLSRALAHDLAYDPLRDLWLREADVTRLASREPPAGFWSRYLVDPVLQFITRRIIGARGLGERVQETLPPLVRMRRMKPLFDGVHLVRLLYDGLMSQGTPQPGRSLMPAGHRLETFVTVTDFFGFVRHLPLHDPPVIAEREHRHIFAFSYVHWRNGEVESDFADEQVPGLAFAARATSSFPGAYPPARIAEVEQVLEERGLTWHGRERFFVQNFSNYLRAGIDPREGAFIDGSVLNNKPFAHAIRSITGRPAFREVDRRIVYVDPHPEELMVQSRGQTPNLWRTLKAALSDIPRNEPVHDDLAEIQQNNKQVRMVRSVIDAIKPRVGTLVAEITDDAAGDVTAETIRRWRIAANTRAAEEAGYAYEGYTRLKIQAAVRHLSGVVADICGFAWDLPAHQKLAAVLEVWALRDPIERHGIAAPGDASTAPEALPNWVRFLTHFDLDYQRRRLRYVISELNGLYAAIDDEENGIDVARLDALKGRFYDLLAPMRRIETGDFVTDGLRRRFREAFSALDDDRDLIDPAMFYAAHRSVIEQALADLAEEMGLDEIKRQADAIFADIHNETWPPRVSRTLLLAYLGFGYWDVITSSIMGRRDMGELNEIKIDRISPNDARSLMEGGAAVLLKGVAMRHFGAFFSRKDRENDYIWGRLNAAERLIDILTDTARMEGAARNLRGMQAKKKAFAAILDVEEPYVPSSRLLIERLRERLKEL